MGGGIEGEGRTYYEYKYMFGRRWNWENDKKYILYLGGGVVFKKFLQVREIKVRLFLIIGHAGSNKNK